jgi:hypothetical protein
MTWRKLNHCCWKKVKVELDFISGKHIRVSTEKKRLTLIQVPELLFGFFFTARSNINL